MINATTAAALKQELSRKSKTELIFLCGKYGITGYEGKVKAELKTFMLKHSALLLGKGKHPEVEPATPPRRGGIKDFLRVWWSRLFNSAAGWASIIGLVLTLGVGSYVAGPFGDDSDDPFDPNQGEYSILILPFAPLQDCTSVDTHMEEAIRRRLLEISDQEGLGLQVKVYKGGGCPRTFTEGRELGARFKADLVVWGDYYDVCSTELEACVKYALVKQVPGVEKQGTSTTESLKLSQIQEGKLQGDIDFIIQWSLGLREYEGKNWKQALAHFQSIKKEMYELSYYIGTCYYLLGNREKAISHYSDAIYNAKQCALSIADLGQGIRLNPKYAVAFYNRGNVYNDLKKLDLAITDYGQAIVFNPQFLEAFHNRGLTYSLLKKYDQAIADYGKVLSLNPQFFDAFYHRGIAYAALKKNDQAIVDYGQAIRLNPQDVSAFYHRGIAYAALKKNDQAIVDYGQAIRLNPQYFRAFNNRGVVYYDLKKYDLALADFVQAIRLNPQEARAFINRGIAYKDLEKYDQAIADFDQAIALKPQNDLAFYNRGNANRALKKYAQAIADYESVIRFAGPEHQSNVVDAMQRIKELRLKQANP